MHIPDESRSLWRDKLESVGMRGQEHLYTENTMIRIKVQDDLV